MYNLIKSDVRFKDLCVGDTFTFHSQKHLVLETIYDRAICYNYKTHSNIIYTLTDQRVTPIKCACAQCESEFETVEVNSLSELRIGDIFKYTGNWQVFLGSSSDGDRYVAYDLFTGELTEWYGYCERYDKLVDADVEFVFEGE